MKREFFVPIRIESGNVRLRSHWAARRKRDREIALAVLAIANLSANDLSVFGPHPRRRIRFTVYRKRALDIDNLWAGIKPVLDSLKCPKLTTNAGTRVLSGFIWDDAPKWVVLEAEQEIVKTDEQEGVRIEIWTDDVRRR